MDEQGFKNFCAKGERVPPGLSTETIRAHLALVGEFEAFLQKADPEKDFTTATNEDVRGFLDLLIAAERNTWENILALLRYARFTNTRAVELALLEVLEAVEVLRNISALLLEHVDERLHATVFEGIEFPTLGSQVNGWPEITQRFMGQLEETIDEQTVRKVLLSGPHAGPREAYLHERELFLTSKDIDDFLERRHQAFVEVLEKHMREDTLFYNQPIDEEVLEYVRSTKTCAAGVREGDIVYQTKIPYMAREYLQEEDETLKRYYYCHCPWVRDAIKSGMEISPTFCYCSAGFTKRPWDVILDRDVEVEVVESVLSGGRVCKFAVHLPQEFVP